MKRHGNIFEGIISFDNLLLASHKAMKGKKFKSSTGSFYFNLENEIFDLQEELRKGIYHPSQYTQFEIREPKVRKICCSEFKDRVIHHAICNKIEPIFESRAIYDSYACRVGKGAHAALFRCQKFTKSFNYFLKCDIRKFFESIDHLVLKKLIRKVFKDYKLISLLDFIIDHKVPGNFDGKGLPIGNLTSQHFANFYLGELDHFIKDCLRVKGYVRYMDDFILFAENKNTLHGQLEKIRLFLHENLKLILKEKVTMIAPTFEGVPYLGFRVFPGMIRLKRENLVRMRRTITKKEKLFKRGIITEKSLIQSVNSILAHVSHMDSLGARRKIIEKSLKLA